MTTNTILYKKTVDRFNKRFWRYFSSYLILNIFFLLIPLLNLNRFSISIFAWFIPVIIYSNITAYFCYKHALNKISLVTASADKFEIEVITKDTPHVYVIQKKHLSYKTKWISSRPNILKLTLLNQNTPIADFYSVGRELEEQELETIVYHIEKHRRANP